VQLIRRLYLYAMAGVMLAILAVGVRLLLTVLFDTVGLGRGDVVIIGDSQSREQLRVAAALVAVGLPVWSIHWWLIRRAWRDAGPEGEDERRSAVRAFYLAIVLAVTIVFVAAAGAEILRAALLAIAGPATTFGASPDVPGALATLLVAGAVWAYHAIVAAADDAAAASERLVEGWLRLYRYGVVLVATFVAVEAIGNLAGALVSLLTESVAVFEDADALRAVALSQVGLITVVGLVAAVHVWQAQTALSQPGWRGASERRSTIRAGFFVSLLGLAAISAMFDLTAGGRAVLVQLLGGAATPVADVMQPSGAGAGILVPFLSAAAWLVAAVVAHRQGLSEARRSPIPGWVGSLARFDAYLLALIGLNFGAVGLAGLIGTGIDATLGPADLSGDAGSRTTQLASYLPAAVAGWGLWAWQWSRVVARTASDPAAEASSSVRRSALLLVLGVSLVATVASLAVILYRVFNLLLGVPLGGGIISELSTPLGTVLVAGAIALYHGRLFQVDARVRAAAPGAATDASKTELGPLGTPGAPPVVEQPASRTLVLRAGSTGELEATLSLLRAHLPAGARLDDG
jgi:hypothetical protein